MRSGFVVNLRVNPRDCQGILDVMAAANINTQDMSFSMQVSLALSSLLESARITNLIPEPDEFQYLNRMQPYIGRMRNGMKKKTADVVNSLGPLRRVAALPGDAGIVPEGNASPLPTPEPAEVSLADRGKRTRLAELNSKRDLSLSSDSITWQKQDQIEFEALYLEVYGEVWHE